MPPNIILPSSKTGGQGLISWGRFSGKVLLLISPQLLVSLAAIMSYARAGMFPDAGISLHLAAITTGQLLFFGLWAEADRLLQRPHQRWFRLAYATGLFLKAMILNLVYAVSYTTFRLWHSYLTWDNLMVGTKHLVGFYHMLGWIVPVALLLFAALLAGLFVLFYWQTPRLLRWQGQAFSHPASRRYSGLLVGMAGLTTYWLWALEPSTAHILPKDPILAFWSPTVSKDPPLSPAMLSLNRAADFVPPKRFHRRNVIVVTIDCLRRDHVPFHGYDRDTVPFLSSLISSGNARYVDFAISNANTSPQGIRSVLGSRLPNNQIVYDFKLHDALKRAGYRTHLIAAGDHTSLVSMRKHYGPNFDLFSDGLDPSPFSVNDDRRILSVLQDLAPFDGEPALFYFHLMSPHGLGLRLPEYQRWQPSALILDWIPYVTGRYDTGLMRNTYDNGILQADRYLAEIFSLLKAKGYLDDYIGVITGDHGEGLGERGHFGHTGFLFMEDIGVPLVFIQSDKTGSGPLPMGSQIDIAPTLHAQLGLPRPAQWQGQSLHEGDPPEALYAESRRNGEDWHAVVHKNGAIFYKYIVILSPQSACREMLFNLSADPQERTNLLAAPDESEQLARMRLLARKKFKLLTPSAN